MKDNVKKSFLSTFDFALEWLVIGFFCFLSALIGFYSGFVIALVNNEWLVEQLVNVARIQ